MRINWQRRPLYWVVMAVSLGIVTVTILGLTVHGVFPDPTEYSVGFKEKNWARVRIGMEEKELEGILGTPLETTEVGQGRIYRLLHARYNECYPDLSPSEYRPDKIEYRLLSYSRPGRWTDSYYVRAVKIDRSAHILEIQGGFYWD